MFVRSAYVFKDVYVYVYHHYVMLRYILCICACVFRSILIAIGFVVFSVLTTHFVKQVHSAHTLTHTHLHHIHVMSCVCCIERIVLCVDLCVYVCMYVLLHCVYCRMWVVYISLLHLASPLYPAITSTAIWLVTSVVCNTIQTLQYNTIFTVLNYPIAMYTRYQYAHACAVCVCVFRYSDCYVPIYRQQCGQFTICIFPTTSALHTRYTLHHTTHCIQYIATDSKLIMYGPMFACTQL